MKKAVCVLAIALGAFLHAAPSGSPVADAAQGGDRETVRALLKQAADVNASQADGMTALHWAAMRNDADLAQTLLYAGANVKATTRINSYTPLLLAAKNGNAAVMEPLIKGGADVNAPTSNGTTPLMFAAAAGNVEAVTLLIDHKVDVTRRKRIAV
ncbi:MAG TPA: ankyrin repeat domain-containing protein [Vicinamibacterales bacterium]|nr:ankyrin repeat domain-containing protein [Vicinamibacterales bacterium]